MGKAVKSGRVRSQPARLVLPASRSPLKAVRPDRPAGRVLVGTASWSDPGFIADWYPKRVPPARRLAWYAEHFRLVEVNSTFYAVPPAARVQTWCDQTPDGFVFDVKLHRLLSRHSTPVRLLPTGLRRLAGRADKADLTPELEAALVDVILESLAPMEGAGKLGALLLQLSPSFGPKRHALTDLDCLLARDSRGFLKSKRVRPAGIPFRNVKHPVRLGGVSTALTGPGPPATGGGWER
jgi:uncharacterized protein YecE (DUF72 family)